MLWTSVFIRVDLPIQGFQLLMTHFVSKKGAKFSEKLKKIRSIGVSNPKLAFFVGNRGSENRADNYRRAQKKGSGKTTPF